MHSSRTSDKIRLSVIFLQYDRQKYTFALERLVSLVSSFESIDFKIVVVDNAHPGFWQHEVSDRIIQVGGDNSAWEFSAFDRGIGFLAATARPADVYAFVTDAFLAYGDDYLELIDEDTLRYCLELRSCVGWVDSFMQDLSAFGYYYRDWMRTSLFFLPAELLANITPLTTPLALETIFGPTAEAPFSVSAPLNANLREHLLAWLTKGEAGVALKEAWHSQLDLTDRSFAFFKAKVAAILREHLLSARLQALGIPCHDFRLVRRLAESNVDLSKTSVVERRGWPWLAGRDAKVEKRPRYYLDSYAAPRATVHGYSSELKLIGWIATEPQIREVMVRLSNDYTVGGVCDVPRPDAIAALPEYTNDLCGFELSANLNFLVPGTYDVEWVAPGFGLSESLGKIDVLPRSVFDAQYCFLPDSAFPGQDIPVMVEGVLECSYPLQSIRALWDGKPVGLTARFSEMERKPSGLYLYRAEILGEIHFSEGTLQHRLELEFQSENAALYTGRRFQAIAVEETRPHTLLVKEVGELDPKSGLVPIHIRGGVLADDMEDRLALMWDGKVIYEETLAAVASSRGPIAWFEVQREVTKVPVGTWEFSLSLKKQGRSPDAFVSWRDRVKLTEPVIHMELLEARLPEKNPSHYFLGVCGWVEHHHLVDRLLLKLDDELVATLAVDHFRTDIAAHLGEVLVKRQGFHADVVLNASPGEHTVQLVAVQENGPDVVWSKPLVLEEHAAAGFLLRSPDLDEFVNSAAYTCWSSITVSGEVLSRFESVIVTLEVGGKTVDRQEISGSFGLRHVPDSPGEYEVRVRVQFDERTLYDSGVVDVNFMKIELPPEMPATIDHFIDRFDLREFLGLEEPGELAHHLVQLEREGLPELREMFQEIEASLEAEKSEMALVSSTRSRDLELRVLFACWEVPCSRHGGGVWMTNLLKQFHRDGKHKVTLVHAYGPGEDRWVDEVRPYVAKIISVPRMHQPALYRGDSRIPAVYYNDYTPALRAAIEAEVFAGGYDIVNHEYTKMFSHMSRGDVAQTLVVHENIFSAHRTNLRQDPPLESDTAIEFLRLLNNFYFLTSALPRACQDIIGLTKEDTALLSGFQDRARVYINTIGVETDFLVPDEAPRQFQRDHPTVVFLGNYHHPPNIDAALFFANKVMPGLRKKYPELEFLIIGSYPSDALQELDSKEAGISVTGFVDDYRPYLFAGNAFVAPIFTGAGMRVKILEAMACGIPVVGTGLSMNGVGAVPEEHYYRADTAPEFVEAVSRCLEDPYSAKSVGRQGRKLIVDKHSYLASARQREAIWYTAIEHWRRARPTQHQKLALVRGASEIPG